MKQNDKSGNKVTLSVCMIVRDEEAVIERCLKNVSQFADEIIVVDTGSVDRTVEIAGEYTSFVYSYEWVDDFAGARNYSYSFACCDYVMWMDADDDLEPEDIARLKELKNNMPQGTDVVFLTYAGEADDNDLLSDSYLIRDRIIKRDLDPVWEFPIHEAIPIKPEWKELYRPDIRVFHRKIKVNEERRNIRIFEKKLSEGFKLNDFNRAYYCRELHGEGRYEETAEQFSLLWEKGEKENLSYALYFYIDSMKHLKRFEELKERIEQYTKRFGPNDMAYCAIGDICRREGDYLEAINWYEKARAVQIDSCDFELHIPSFHDFLPLLGMAKAFLKMGDKEKAKEMLTRAEQIRPENTELKILKLWL